MKKIRSQFLEKRERAKSERKKYEEMNKQHQEENKSFLRKFKKKPLYLIN